MATVTNDKLLDLLHGSGLVEEERLAPFLDALAARFGPDEPATSEQTAAALVEANLITQWQADKLLDGKSKGFLLGKYKLLGQVGKGGMSTVYLAEHLKMRRQVAIKVLPKDRVDDSSYLSRFYQEARAAAQLNDQNIVRAYDVDNEGDTHFLVMEYVNGRDLHVTVTQDGALDYELAADYIRQAAQGLSHAHKIGLVHRDVKPANLLVDQKKTVKVLDMGLAKFTETAEPSLTLAHDEAILGTADYLAPEQALDSHRADQRADIYGLGCTLYFLLTGHPPFNEGSIRERLMKHQLESPPSIYKDRPDVPPGLVNICNRMMVKKPENRYQSAADLVEALGDWLSDRGYEGASDSGRRQKPADAMGSSGYPIGRLQRPIPVGSPSSDTASESNKDTTRISARSDDEELGFAPVEEELAKAEELSDSGASVLSDIRKKTKPVDAKESSEAGLSKDPSDKPASSIISKSLVEEEFEDLPPVPAAPSGAEIDSATVIRRSTGQSNTGRRSTEEKPQDNQVLVWVVVAVFAAIAFLLLLGVIFRDSGTRPNPSRTPTTYSPTESTVDLAEDPTGATSGDSAEIVTNDLGDGETGDGESTDGATTDNESADAESDDASSSDSTDDAS